LINIVKKVINIPKEFNSSGNISVNNLLIQTGYIEVFNQIGKEEIKKELINNPSYISEWLSWSEDKRTTSGWYFKDNENGSYSVGYFSDKIGKEEIYSDINEACSIFIKNEIEEIRKTR
jgi:hypothetical protein